MENEIKILNQDQIEEELKSLPGWKQEGDKIKKQFEFDSFMSVIDLINKLAPFFESIDHHADMCIAYKKITFELQRFDVGGKITNRDFIVAHEIERMVSEMEK